jgi:FtsH-binding integral membrane protein
MVQRSRLIALSIVFVASEVLHQRAGRQGLTARYPWIVAFVFGLLHGFGFAGALSEVGLPQNEIPLALFQFNVGVEIGQLLFVAAAITVIAIIERVPVRWPKWMPKLPSYAIGGLATFWLIQRLSLF